MWTSSQKNCELASSNYHAFMIEYWYQEEIRLSLRVKGQKAMSSMATFTKLPNGDLRIALTDDYLPGGKYRDELEELHARDDMSIDNKLLDVCEWELCNGWQVVTSSETGDLTSALLFSDDAQFNEHGTLIDIGHSYYNPRYAIEDEVEILLEQGYIDFACHSYH